MIRRQKAPADRTAAAAAAATEVGVWGRWKTNRGGVRGRNERLRRQKRNKEADKLTADGRK